MFAVTAVLTRNLPLGFDEQEEEEEMEAAMREEDKRVKLLELEDDQWELLSFTWLIKTFFTNCSMHGLPRAMTMTTYYR